MKIPTRTTFSVLIPAYEAAGTIATAVASALGQTTPPHEIIVSDDGSSDDLEGALAPFRDRITLLRGEHGGAAAALNRALAAASGEFVVALDADDALLPGALEALGRLAVARPGHDLLSTDAWFVQEGRVVGRFYAENDFAQDDQRAAIVRSCFVAWPAARRERLAALGGWDVDLKITSDWDAWMRMIFDGARAALVDEPLRRYVLRPGSLSAARADSMWERVTLLDKLAAHEDLPRHEREVLAAVRRAAVARARREDAREALELGWPDARGRGLALAGSRGAGAGSRVLGLGGALAPRLTARLLARGVGRRPGDGRAPVAQPPSSSS